MAAKMASMVGANTEAERAEIEELLQEGERVDWSALDIGTFDIDDTVYLVGGELD